MEQLSQQQSSLTKIRKYLDMYYTGKAYDPENMALMKFCHDLCFFGDVLYGKVLDYGCGPTVYMLLPLCGIATEMHVADIDQPSLDEVQMWVDKDSNAYNWDQYTNAAEKVCGRKISTGWVKSRLTKVIQSDLRNFNINDFDFAYEAVISTFCLENVAHSSDEYEQYANLLLELVLPGGKFGFISTSGDGWDLNGDFIPTPLINEQSLARMFKRFKDKEITTIPISEDRGYDRIVCIKGINE